MSKHCAIQAFMDLGNDLVVSLHTHRYGGGIVAMVCCSSNVNDFVDSVEDNNGESEWEHWGLRDSWYPIAEGEGISDALNRLRSKLEQCREDWSSIITAIEIMPRFPCAAVARVKCKVVAIDQLRDAIQKWNDGVEITDIF